MVVFFMFLSILENSSAWNILLKVLEVKTLTLEHMIWGLMHVVRKVLSELFVNPVAQSYSMQCLEEIDANFKKFFMAVEAIDVSF